MMPSHFYYRAGDRGKGYNRTIGFPENIGQPAILK